MSRADLELLRRGLAPSRSAAQRLIADGAVWIGAGSARRPVTRAAQSIAPDEALEVEASRETRFVSRAGAKLDAAIAHVGLDCEGLVALDVGMSTGGFTDCLLARGARRVVGIEVGHGQLHPRLRDDPRVTCLEGVNARALSAEQLGAALPAGGFGLIVADVSFISLTLVLPALVPLARADAPLLALVKPQFELDRSRLDRRGIVADPADHARVQARLREALAGLGCPVLAWFESAVPGGDGNREFFVLARAAAVR